MTGIRTRKRGKSWYFAFEAKNLNGKRKVVEKGGFKTEREAINVGIKEFGSYKCRNIALVSEKISLVEFLKGWLEVKSKEVHPGTAETYESNIKRINQIKTP